MNQADRYLANLAEVLRATAMRVGMEAEAEAAVNAMLDPRGIGPQALEDLASRYFNDAIACTRPIAVDVIVACGWLVYATHRLQFGRVDDANSFGTHGVEALMRVALRTGTPARSFDEWIRSCAR